MLQDHKIATYGLRQPQGYDNPELHFGIQRERLHNKYRVFQQCDFDEAVYVCTLYNVLLLRSAYVNLGRKGSSSKLVYSQRCIATQSMGHQQNDDWAK